MDSSELGGIDGEAGGRMEVTDKCSNTGEVMGIEFIGVRASFCYNGGMGLRTKKEARELGTSGFSPTTEDDRVILGKNSGGCFSEEDAAVVVTQFTNAHQVVMEVRYYVADLDGELREEQVT